MKIMLSKNDKLVSITRLGETEPIQFLDGTDLIIHEDNLAYILSDRDIDNFNNRNEFVFNVSTQRVSYVLNTFLSNPDLLKLNASKLEKAIQDDNDSKASLKYS